MNYPNDEYADELTPVMLALRDYRASLETGHTPDRLEFLSRYSDIAGELADCLDGLEFLRSAAPNFSTSPAIDPELPAPLEGTLGDYRLIREVGRGGMGVVYEAEQISLRRRVALKVLPFAAGIDHRQLQRFKNEASAAAHLRHESIVPVYAVGNERGIHYYVMQFVDGQSLADLIAELRHPVVKAPTSHPAESTLPCARLPTERHSGGPAYFDWVAGVGRQAALALEYAHQTGVVHRDVKPGNLLLDSQGQLWITDFGLAQVSGDTGLTMTGELLGTLRYASPEQAVGKRGVIDHRSDVYSLGATLCELLTLRPPFAGDDRHELLRQIVEDEPSLRSINSTIPVELETIILKTLRKEPGDRYATAQELADDLQRFLSRQPVLARRPGFAERFRVWGRRHPTAIFVGVVALLLITAGSLLSVVMIRSEQERTLTEQQRTLTEQQRAEEAYQRERQRAEEAKARLTLARRAVDELFRMSEEELADRPGMEMLRKRLLCSSLAFYQEFLEEHRDDPEARAELLDTTRRVETILADLAVLRAATHFYLLCQPVVLDDLQLSPEQRVGMKELTSRVGKEWMESFRDIGLVSHAVRSRRAINQAWANESELNSILSPAQHGRLRQIGLQSEGLSAIRDPEVAVVLGLTADQRERIRVIEDNAVFGWMRAIGRSGTPRSPLEPKEQSMNAQILAVLTNVQAQKWREITGEPIKGPLVVFGSLPSAATQKIPKAGTESP
ncbi:MAG TPA: protein kinase [Gemmata sp.]|jgi:hypothetical protein|nr:protein kinase [Gemmata sp.]